MPIVDQDRQDPLAYLAPLLQEIERSNQTVPTPASAWGREDRLALEVIVLHFPEDNNTRFSVSQSPMIKSGSSELIPKP
jgi:hypothetical protein